MDVNLGSIADLTEAELVELMQNAEKTLEERRARSTPKEVRRRGKAVQKYQNPENPTETWSGRGRPPGGCSPPWREGGLWPTCRSKRSPTFDRRSDIQPVPSSDRRDGVHPSRDEVLRDQLNTLPYFPKILNMKKGTDFPSGIRSF